MINLEDYMNDDSQDFRGMWVKTSGPEKGMIVSYLRCGWEQSQYQERTGCRLVYGDFRSDQYYIDDYDVAQPRPKITETTAYEIQANGTDEVVVSGVPAGTVVLNEKRASVGTVDDGSFEFDTTIPGFYSFRLEPPFPHQIQEITINAL